MRMIEDYHILHQCPELDRQLPKTLAYINAVLSALRCCVFSPAEGAIAAYFDFGKAQTLAFRADIDAVLLPQGPVHACGHDGHTAILLELARWLSAKPDIPHNVLLLFQPAEETDGGARELCGLLPQYKVFAIFGLHLWPALSKGQIYSRSGVLMSHATQIQLSFLGKSCHIARPELGQDALAAACRFYNRVENLHLPKGCLLKFGALHGGTAPNVICDRAELSGSLRYLQDKNGSRLKSQLTGICKKAAYFTGCRGSIQFSSGYPAVDNDPSVFSRATELFSIHTLKEPLMTTDDFSFYQKTIPGVYFLLGLGDVPPLHSPGFHFDPAVLQIGVQLFQSLCKI